MTKKKNDKSNDCAECDCRNLEEALFTLVALADVAGWKGEEEPDPWEASGVMALLESEHGTERVLRGAFGALRDYEQLLRRNR